ncbi:hypothetical protein Q5Y75_11610 [Ruegeria sp. 2205SS24-7]|uniref:hypothetical protein n=1 Tax=Ruegeria discodermiae TaxID=3064389 RepID=UPI002740C022|nr:hypothetical protein [Ruegeria sp. 2205SS24-7]MDP5217866.1 hypothetical protein [Ruegeria sp. 2205SS24-7]
MQVTDRASRRINLFRKPRGKHAPAIYDRLDRIQLEVERTEDRRARDRKTEHKFRQCLRAICLDLFVAHTADPEMLIGVSRDNSRLSKPRPDHPDFVSARPFLDALEGLIRTGYAEQVSLGIEASGKSSRIRGTSKLIDHLGVGQLKQTHIIDNSDPIRLKVGPKGDKKLTAFLDTAETQRWRANVKRINEHLQRYQVTLDLDPMQFQEMERQRLEQARFDALAEVKPIAYQRTNTGAVSLFRVFNSEDWAQGGRFYGGWWQQIPKQYRRHILINGKLTCEFDYSAMHLRLIYKLAGADMPDIDDPYAAPYGPTHRTAVKRAFAVMLNAKKRPRSSTVPEFNQQELGMTWEQFLDGILEFHEPLRDHMLSGKGTVLQRMDADIAEAVLLKFTSMNLPCLPIHDSFITYSTMADELPDIMESIAATSKAIRIPSRHTHTGEYTGPTGLVEDNIEDLLNETIQGQQITVE